jgi:PiT family inorganic phosphate transporter
MQKPTMIFLAASHGSNDAQKSMGVIALILAAGSGEMHGSLYLPEWAVVSCAAVLALGLASGGWRIVKSVGYGICRLEPVHSFASQLTAASVILVASLAGGPVSTAQVVGSSVMGVGASRRLSGVRWSAAANIAYAWLLTVPVSAGIGAGAFWILKRIIVE